MARLRERPDDLYALVAAASDSLGLAPAFVEKDFWVTEVLRAATRAARANGAVAVFKGGTSLSKAFGVVKRFSEDVDVLLLPPASLGPGARHGVLKRIGAEVGNHLGVPERDREVRESETGVKRNVLYRYARRFRSASLRDGVLLEMGVRGGDQPRRRCTLRSLVAAHVVSAGKVGEADFDELAPVEVEVLHAVRTLVEKLALLHDLASRFPAGGSAGGLARAGRHYYDIHELLGHDETKHALQAEPRLVERLAADVGEQSRLHGLRFTIRPPGGYAESPAFDRGHPCQQAAAGGYGRAAALIYGRVPSFPDCLRRVREAGPLL